MDNLRSLDSVSAGHGLAEFTKRISYFITTASISGSEGRNTMWRRFGLTIRAGLPDEQNPRDAKLNLLIEETSALSRTVDNIAGSRPSDDRMGAFFSQVLDTIPPGELARINLEPQGDYVVTATAPSIDIELKQHFLRLGQVHRVKVNFQYL
jgi:hypothetical protein